LQKDIPFKYLRVHYGHRKLSGSASGFGGNAVIYVQATKMLGIGLTYRSKVNMAVSDGQATFTVPSSLEENFPDGSFSSSLPLPQVFTLGLSFKINEKWSVAMDLNYVGWKAYDTLAFDYETNTSSLADTKSARNYENIAAFRTGVNYKVNDKFDLRLGIARGNSPVKYGYVTPETPDGNRINYTAGFGYKMSEHFEMDASVFYTHVQRTDTNIETGMSGTYTTNVIAPGIAVIYKFN